MTDCVLARAVRVAERTGTIGSPVVSRTESNATGCSPFESPRCAPPVEEDSAPLTQPSRLGQQLTAAFHATKEYLRVEPKLPLMLIERLDDQCFMSAYVQKLFRRMKALGRNEQVRQ